MVEEGVMSENRIQGWKAICDYLGQSAYRIRRQCYPVYHMPESRLVWAVPEELDAHTARLFTRCREKVERQGVPG